MAFIQIIDLKTDRIDEIKEHVDEFVAKTEGRRTTQRTLLCRDRDQEGHYVNVVFFDSYESAMENSSLPETAEFAEKLGSVLSEPATFTNLEVEWDET